MARPEFWSPAIGKQGGVGILISSNFDGNVLSWVKDSSGRVVSVLIEFAGFRVNLVNIYAPTNLTERKAFFADLHHFFIPADGLILGGDFNCYESDLDKFGGNVSLASYFSEFHSAFNLVDIWHKQHRRQREMSWFNSNLIIGSRLDKYLLSSKLVDLPGACDIMPCCLSDHDYVNLVIDFSNSTPRGPGIWKFKIPCFRTTFFVIICQIVLLIYLRVYHPLTLSSCGGIFLKPPLRQMLFHSPNLSVGNLVVSTWF